MQSPNKTFVGHWISDKARKKLKVACAVHNVRQGDIMELLILKWIEKPYIQAEVIKLTNDGKQGEKK